MFNKKAIQWDMPALLIITFVAVLVIILLIGIFSGKLYEIAGAIPFF